MILSRFSVQTVKWYCVPVLFLTENEKLSSLFYCLIILCLLACKVFSGWIACPLQTVPLLLYCLSLTALTAPMSTAVRSVCTPSIGFDHSSVAPTFWTGRLWTPLFQHHKAGPVVPGFGASPSHVWVVLRAGRGASATLLLLVACAKEHGAASLSLGKALSKRGWGRRGMDYLGPDCELGQSYLAVFSFSPMIKSWIEKVVWQLNN